MQHSKGSTETQTFNDTIAHTIDESETQTFNDTVQHDIDESDTQTFDDTTSHTIDESETQTFNDTVTKNLGSTVMHNLNNSTTLMHGKIVTDTTKIERTSNISGNIGVTTSQQMAEQELEISAKLNIMNYIIESFKERFCLLVW